MNRVYKRKGANNVVQRDGTSTDHEHGGKQHVNISRHTRTYLPAVQHPLLRRGTGNIALTVTQAATGLHPFTPSAPRTQPAMKPKDAHFHLTKSKTPILPQADGAHQSRNTPFRLVSGNFTERNEAGNHLLPPIRMDKDTEDNKTPAESTVELSSESDSEEEEEEAEEEEEEEEEEEVIVTPTHNDMEPVIQMKFHSCDPHGIFPATIFQCHAFLDYKAALETVDVGVLKRCLSRVCQLHPLLKVMFIQGKQRIYLQVSKGEPTVQFNVTTGSCQRVHTVIEEEVHKPFELVIEAISEADEEMLCSSDCSRVENVATLEEDRNDVSDSKLPYSQSLKHFQLHYGNGPKTYLFRSQLLSHNIFDHTLILTFPCIVCDFWSSSFFARQLAAAYAVEEVRPTKDGSKGNREALKRWSKNFLVAAKPMANVSYRTNPQFGQHCFGARNKRFNPLRSSKINFMQVAWRELEISVVLSKERQWSLWETLATKTVRNVHGIQRVKTVAHVKLPTHLKMQAAKQLKQIPTSMKWQTEHMSAQQATDFKFLKIDEEVTEHFLRMLPQSFCSYVDQAHYLYFMCLGCFAVLLARCCRGWNGNHQTQLHLSTVHEDGLGDSRRRSSIGKRPPTRLPSARYFRSRLMSARSRDVKTSVVLSPPGSGQFLIGTELSLRQFTSDLDGLLGPLSNDAFVRVNLSQCTTFLDLMSSLSSTMTSLHQHIHFPFASVADDVNLPRSLPVRLYYLNKHDVLQLASPDEFYFTETAVGVSGQGLARLGTKCYLSPLNGQLHKDCQMELVLWENTDNCGLGGGFRYQPHLILPRVIDSLIKSFGELVEAVADHPTISLNDLVSLVKPPFLPSRQHRSKSCSKSEMK
ncbi:uncharacterized protein LOC134190835 isoform X2 [Corticium candelabrum]|uniref:uncharacterized protein LOC134190835 isoform X2 n=1 Tax=Corticium candelabrum TaxID=121492 RepID=UPI002E274D1B|nr:uncharacterized protein LOC134190835 isoform X2 [Corticium candelabrum]